MTGLLRIRLPNSSMSVIHGPRIHLNQPGSRDTRSSSCGCDRAYMLDDPFSSETRVSNQFVLFKTLPPLPEGMLYADDFVSPATEQALISEIRGLPLQPFQFGPFEGKRRVASFGFRYDYSLRRLEPADPIPPWLADIAVQVESFGGPATRIRQVLCTEYDIGVGIGWHRDKPHFDKIFGLSLGSACKFRFRKPAGTTW